MTQKISSATAAQLLNTILARIFVGGQPSDLPRLVLYKGVRPAAVETAVPSTDIVVTYDLSKTAPYTLDSDATKFWADIKIPNPKLAERAGEVTFFRIYGPSGLAVFEGDVTDRAGDGELKISITNILTGIYVRILSARITISTVN